MGEQEIVEDGHELPPGCAPYIPAPIDALMRVVEYCPVGPKDVFVDIGCGTGRAATFVRLLSGASIIGVDVQSHLVSRARALALRLNMIGSTFVIGDACQLVLSGTVFFLYCPFGAERLTLLLDNLRNLATEQPIALACLHTVPRHADWLVATHAWPDLRLYRSVTRHSRRSSSLG
jgi:SAM-dependent methyltransferase